MLMTYEGYDVTVTLRSNCRRLILRCHPTDRRLTLSVPPGTGMPAIRRFLDSQRDWITAHMGASAPYQPRYLPGERHLLFGQRLTLGAPGMPRTEAELTRLRVDRLEALVRRLIPLWSERMGVTVARVRLRDMTSRWGSCQTVTHTLTLNLRLALTPEPCVEYVVVHELCHLLHPDHSSAFHGEMTRFLPDWPTLRRRLSDLDLTPLPPEQ